MKITNQTRNEKTKYKNIKVEDVFTVAQTILSNLYLKISEDYSKDSVNAYNFTKHIPCHIDKDTEVIYVPSELILHEKGWKPDNPEKTPEQPEPAE